MIKLAMQIDTAQEIVDEILSRATANYNEMVLCRCLQEAIEKSKESSEEERKVLYRKFIEDKYEFNDDFYFDEEPKIEIGEDGAWINCWMFVSEADLPADQEVSDGKDA